MNEIIMIKKLMSEYLNENKNFSEELPIKPKKDKWQNERHQTQRDFDFNNIKHYEYFIVELLKYKRYCDALFEFNCKEKSVSVKIISPSGLLSNLEFETMKDINKIRNDVVFYHG